MNDDRTSKELNIDLNRVWLGISAEITAPPVSRLEHPTARVLRSPGLARALLTTPSLVLSWIFASVAVLAVGAVATAGSDVSWVPLLAPALAGVAIAYAYGPGVDPAFELSQTMAVSDRMVLLARALAVFGVNALLGIIASLVTSLTVDLTLGWLLPMTTVSAFGLATATLTRSANVGSTAALSGWAIFILGSAYSADDITAAVERGAFIPFYLIGTALCVGLTLYATSGRHTERFEWQ